MDVLQVILRIAHIGGALVLGGGAVFQLLAVVPALKTLDDAQRPALAREFATRWRGAVWVALGLLLASGLLNFTLFRLPATRGQPFAGLYHGLFGLKVLAALAVFHPAVLLTSSAAHLERFRARAGFWLGYMVALVTVIVALGAILRYLPTFYA